MVSFVLFGLIWCAPCCCFVMGCVVFSCCFVWYCLELLFWCVALCGV